jgi:hypothetical protein
MPKNFTSLSLNGKRNINIASLTGGFTYGGGNSQTLSTDVAEFLELITKLYITPNSEKNWDVLRENMTFTEQIEHRLNILMIVHNNNETLKNLKLFLSILGDVFNQHIEILALEQQLVGSSTVTDKNIEIKYQYTLPYIRLKAEYEVFNLIFNMKTKTPRPYDDTIVNEITVLLNKEEFNFYKIKQYILSKYS